MRPTHRFSRTCATLAALGLALAACSGGGGGDAGADGTPVPDGLATDAAEGLTPGARIAAQVASFDLATGEDQRLLVGVFNADRGVIVGGDAQFRIGYLGSGEQSADTEVTMSEPIPATFLPVPGNAPDSPDGPRLLADGESGAGVYEAAVDLDQPGNWGVQVTVEVDGEPSTATAAFAVGEQHQVVAVGDPAPASENPTVDDPDAAPGAIDSRAVVSEDDEVPDPELHDETVAALLEQGRPIVVAITTPIYCVSQFCGPITDTIADLSEQYDDRAAFVHLEVWEDFEDQALNPFVEDWILTDTGGNEPWVFLVGADGTVEARWDNVLDLDELTGMLDELPAT